MQETELKKKNQNSGKVIDYLNSLWCDKTISRYLKNALANRWLILYFVCGCEMCTQRRNEMKTASSTNGLAYT